VKYGENQIASLTFTDDNSLRASVRYHCCDYDLCDKDSFDPEKVALFIARNLYYELLKDGFDIMETKAPIDWKVNFVKEFFSWATWLAVFGAGVAALWLIKH
jgi:hypothetical protein